MNTHTQIGAGFPLPATLNGGAAAPVGPTYAPDDYCWDCEGTGQETLWVRTAAICDWFTTECLTCKGTGTNPNAIVDADVTDMGGGFHRVAL